MKLLSLFCLLFALPAAAEPWQRVDPTYALTAKGFTAADGGSSQSDHYLLSGAVPRDFVLTWEMTRLRPVPEQDRAIVCWSVGPDVANRRSIFLSGLFGDVGKPHRFRLAVLGGQASLRMDGQPVGSVVSYGTPPAAGRVGFLHYYRYDYAYRDVRLQPLSAEALPRLAKPSAQVSALGVVTLRWRIPAELEGVLRARVERDTTPAFARSQRWDAGADARFTDRSAAAGRRYYYRVRALLSGGGVGLASEATAITLSQAEPPRPPAEVRATRRVDGSVRLAWSLAPESRAAWVAVRRQGREIGRRGAEAGGFTDAAPGADVYEVVAGDPDGRRNAVVRVRPAPVAPLVSAAGRFPEGHPRLLLSRAELERLRARMGTDESVRLFVRGLQQRAEAMLGRPISLPDPGDSRHNALAGEVRDLSLAALFTGRADFADRARALLRAYAEQYPKWPWNNRRCRTFTQSPLYEAIWAVPLVEGYDLLLGTGRVTPEERRKIEREFLPLVVANFRIQDYATDNRVADLHYRCYNFQAWHLAAVGLIGLLLRDADLMEWVLDGPYGFRHLLAHDIRDDGLFWERSLGYHSFVISALSHLTDAAWRCNLNLYAVEAADRVRRDEDSNYGVDGDNGPKSLARLFEAPFFFVFPDLSYAVVADSSRGPLSPAGEWRVAARRMPDPRLDWLVARGPARRPTAWRGPADVSGKVALSYDEANLYVRAWVSDDVVRNTHREPAQAWAGDLVWLALSAGPKRGAKYDYIYGLIPGDLAGAPPMLVQFTRPASEQARASAGTVAVSRLEAPTPGYHLEAAIPLEEIGLRPAEGLALPGEICLYDGDRTEGAPVKEKMLGWNCRTDRYDPAQGGTFRFGGGAAPTGTLMVPRQTVAVDGRPDGPPPAGAAAIGAGSGVMTDETAAPDLRSLLLTMERERRSPAQMPATAPSRLRFANNGLFLHGSSLFPSSGFALLRAHPGLPWQQPRDALAVNLNYGPYGGGHGHPDRLSLVLYALGRQWIPDLGSCDYDSPLKGQWTAQTVSHNTLVVDGVSQYPTGDRDVTWPVDTPERKAMGRLRFFHSDPVLRVAGAVADTVYDGVRLERTTAVLGSYAVDRYEARSDREHTYDYVLHLDGEPASLPGLSPVEGALGTRCGYQHVTGLSSGGVPGAWEGAWKAPEGTLYLSLLPGGSTEVIAGRSLTNAPERTTPMLIARRRARETTYATVLAPVAPGTPAPAAEAVPTRQGVLAVRVAAPPHRDLLVLGDGREWSVSGIGGDARAVLIRAGVEGRTTLSLARCARFRGVGVQLRMRRPADLYLENVAAGKWRMLNAGAEPAFVSTGTREIRLAPGESQVVSEWGVPPRR